MLIRNSRVIDKHTGVLNKPTLAAGNGNGGALHYGKFWQNLSKKHFRVMQDSNLSHPEFLSAKAT